MRKIDMIVIHCTDSPDSAVDIGIKEVRDWHKQKGWSDIGYHGLVCKQGWYWTGRDIKIPGAHAKGYNKNSIGLVWVGRDVCNTEQYYTLIEKTAAYAHQFKIPVKNVLGHCELPGVEKTCPNLNMTKFRNLVIQKLIKDYGYGQET